MSVFSWIKKLLRLKHKCNSLILPVGKVVGHWKGKCVNCNKIIQIDIIKNLSTGEERAWCPLCQQDLPMTKKEDVYVRRL